MARQRRRLGTAVWDVPESKLPVQRHIRNKCPNCGEIYCTGVLGPGTLIEVKCRRCNAYFGVAVQ